MIKTKDTPNILKLLDLLLIEGFSRVEDDIIYARVKYHVIAYRVSYEGNKIAFRLEIQPIGIPESDSDFKG